MSNMKNLLGDMDFEEFEEMRKALLGRLKGADLDERIGLCCGDTERLYDHWLLIQGRELGYKWVNEHGGHIMVEQLDEYTEYLVDTFIEWLEGVN